MTRLYPFFAILCLLAVACGDDGPVDVDAAADPIDAPAVVTADGTWDVTMLECDGVVNPNIPGLSVTINDTVGEFVLTFAADCVATVGETYAYPDETTISITPTDVTCDPNAGCMAILGADCLPGPPPPADFTWERVDSTLTFTKTSIGPPADNCAAGEQEVYTMALQE